MPAYVVDYDLNRPGQNYSRLSDAIESRYDVRWRMLQSTWVIQTSESAEQIFNALASSIDPNDKLFIARLTSDAAWDGFTEEGDDYLRAVLRGY